MPPELQEHVQKSMSSSAVGQGEAKYSTAAAEILHMYGQRVLHVSYQVTVELMEPHGCVTIL